jgi:hypothetical protein
MIEIKKTTYADNGGWIKALVGHNQVGSINEYAEGRWYVHPIDALMPPGKNNVHPLELFGDFDTLEAAKEKMDEIIRDYVMSFIDTRSTTLNFLT